MIEFDCVITGGYVDIETLQGRANTGWQFVCTIPASQVHPYATGSDKITIFSKYTPYTASGEIPDSPEQPK